MKSPTRALIAGVAVVATAGALAGCASGAGDEAAADGPATIQVAIDAGLEPEARETFDARVAEFEEANPDITIEAQEYTWTGTTFAAELAGGTLPDVFPIPFTDGRGLIEREQIADISALVAELPYADKFNPNVAQAGQDADGNMWAVPIAAYGQGCTTTAHCSKRPDSIPTSHRRPGTKSASTPSRSRMPPAKPATRR